MKLDISLIETEHWESKLIPKYHKQQSTDFFPLGLGYLASAVNNYGINVEIINLNMLDWNNSQLKSYFLSKQPRIVAISSLSLNYSIAKKIAVLAKSVLRNVIVVYGGIHASMLPSEILNDCKEIDFISYGETDYTFPAQMKILLNGGKIPDLPGIYCREGGKIRKNSIPEDLSVDNLDMLPIPNRELLYIPDQKFNYMRNKKAALSTIISSRGCPHNCPYCSTAEFHGRKFRTRSIDSIKSEIDVLINNYDVREISFVDDSFGSDRERLLEMCKLFKEGYSNLEWGCSCRLSDLNEPILNVMADSGCKSIFMGIETLSSSIQRAISKPINLEYLDYVIDFANKRGIRLIIAFMLGFPQETHADREKMVGFVLRNNKKVKDWRFSVLTIYPGTQFWNNASTYGIDLSGVDPLNPYVLAKTYSSVTDWYDILITLVKLYRAAYEGRVKSGKFYKIVSPKIDLKCCNG